MRTFFSIILFGLSSIINGQLRTIHVFVALCDNEHQGIVPVPEKIGNGKDPANNLYWGAGYRRCTAYSAMQIHSGITLYLEISFLEGRPLQRVIINDVKKKLK